MKLITIIDLNNSLGFELTQTLEIIITLLLLFGIIIFLLTTADNKNYFQKQK